MRKIPVFYRNVIFGTIEKELAYQPLSAGRNKKVLVNLNPPWDAEPPIWELRAGNYRIFYDVSESLKEVLCGR